MLIFKRIGQSCDFFKSLIHKFLPYVLKTIVIPMLNVLNDFMYLIWGIRRLNLIIFHLNSGITFIFVAGSNPVLF